MEALATASKTGVIPKASALSQDGVQPVRHSISSGFGVVVEPGRLQVASTRRPVEVQAKFGGKNCRSIALTSVKMAVAYGSPFLARPLRKEGQCRGWRAGEH